jgi:hypothetical protein
MGLKGPGRDDPRLRDVLLLLLAVAGLTACITLLYLGMRAVMDVGGACADGGPYVSAQPCPDGTPAAMLFGAFGLFGFGALGMAYGARIGGYGWLPLLAWTGLFAALGWNFLDYGLVNPPEGEGIEWGYVIPGVMFQLMAWVTVAFVLITLRGAEGFQRDSGRLAIAANTLRGARQPARPVAGDTRPPTVAPEHRVEVAGTVREEQLRAIDALMGAAVAGSAAGSPVGPAHQSAESPTEFREGTPALLDRLERLGDMRDRGLLTAEEYETAKDAVMHELEARS